MESLINMVSDLGQGRVLTGLGLIAALIIATVYAIN